MPPFVQRPTVAEIQLDHVSHNYRQVQSLAPDAAILAVVKANAYGHGLVPMARHFERLGAARLGVAFLEEGIALRDAGLRLPILAMGGICASQIEYFFEYNLEITVSSLEKLQQVEEIGAAKDRTAAIHLKFDTGMGRIGVHPDSAPKLIEAALRAKHCHVAGVFSHFACADMPDAPETQAQLDAFLNITEHFHKLGEPMPLRHIANSGGVLHHPESALDMIRPGILLYGVYPDPAANRVLDLKPALSLKSEVVYFKVLRPNHGLSYGLTWRTDEATRVVTVPLGYGDGFPRALSNRGEVIIRGKKHPIVGSVCMDQFMVNLGPEGTAYNGDEVVLIGEQNGVAIDIETLAQTAGSIPYEILTGLNERIPRIYLPESPTDF